MPDGSSLLEQEKVQMAAPVEVPGRVLETVFIPARAYMRARLVRTGQVLRIIDVEGQQVPDVILYDAHDLRNMTSTLNTRLVNRTWKLREGHVLYSKFCDRMATIVADTVGQHYCGGGFCNEELNFVRYGVQGTPNCRDNLVASMGAYGFKRDDIELDACFCFFMNLEFAPNGDFIIREPRNVPGGYIDLRAEMDVLASISNCPSERNPCNGWRPTPLRVVVYEPHR
jgi:uncharacterized protein YcgI (DUF1989 family)